LFPRAATLSVKKLDDPFCRLATDEEVAIW